MSKINFSRHFMQDRADRYIFIAQTVGFGEVVHTHQVHTTKGSGYVEITTSGLVIVRGDDETVITMYLASFAEIKRYYEEKRVHREVELAAKRNERKGYIEKQNHAARGY